MVGEKVTWGSLVSENVIEDPFVLEQHTISSNGMLSISAYLFSGKKSNATEELSEFGQIRDGSLTVDGQAALENIAEHIENGNFPETSGLKRIKETFDLVVGTFTPGP